ncbi:acrosin-like [Orussus abietinus]|uniref:acrosin-like n=1 Tax=Orussus abietinus TaxID=222816 RepID=UPI000C715CB1|nr:acrosin-like [Orussus abietinus]
MSKYIVPLLVLSNWQGCYGSTLRGTRAREGQFPWLIQFQTIAPCGGVLISPDWVLTAAQCVQHNRNSIELYAVGLNGTGSRQTVNVKATYIFPQFVSYSKVRDHDHNIALLKLVQAFDMCDSKVRLLDIAPVRLDDNYKSCLIFGWQSYVAPTAKVLAKPVQYSEVILNSWKLCMYMLKSNASYGNVFCTMIEAEDGMKACAGNPGSPVVCEDQYQRMVLLGIASWSNFSLDCGGLPTYLGVSVFRSWMYDLIFNDKKMEQLESGFEPHGGACKRERYLGGISIESSGQNYTDLLQLSGQPSVLRKSPYGAPKLSELQSKLEPPLFDNHVNDYGRVSTLFGTQDGMPFGNVVKERDSSLRQYQEIGKVDDVMAISAEHSRPSFLDKPMVYQTQFRKEIHEDGEDDEPDDNMEVDYEDITRSCCSRFNVSLRLFYIPYLEILYIIFSAIY